MNHRFRMARSLRTCRGPSASCFSAQEWQNTAVCRFPPTPFQSVTARVAPSVVVIRVIVRSSLPVRSVRLSHRVKASCTELGKAIDDV